MSVQHYVHASYARDGDGMPIPSTAGALLAADGAGGSSWEPSPAIASDSLTFVSNAGPAAPPLGDLTVYTNLDKLRYIDSGSNVFTVATTTDLGNYLPLAGGTMAGVISMGGFTINNCLALRMNAPGGNVVVGDAFTNAGPGLNNAVYGPSASTSSDNTVVVGGGSVANTDGTIVIGAQSASNGLRAHCFGKSLINSVAGSLLLDCTANIRSAPTCDLGTSAVPFRTLYLNTSLATTTATCDIGTALNPFRSLYLSNSLAAGAITSYGNSVPVWKCSHTDTLNGFGLTVAETNLIQGPLLGSLTFPAPTAAGLTIKMFGNWLATFGAATTLTIRLKVNGTTVMTKAITPGALVNNFIQYAITIQLRSPSNRLYTSISIDRDGGIPSIFGTITDSIWNTAGSNTLSLTGQFSDVNGTLRDDSFDMWASHAS